MLAYNDVLDAWNYYLKNDNGGRGVVLVGHSQGSGVLTQLITQRDRRQAGAGEDHLRAAARHEPAGREGQGRRRVPEHPAVQVGIADRLRGRVRELPRQRAAAGEFALRQGAGREHGRGVRESGRARRRQRRAARVSCRTAASSRRRRAAPKPWVTPEQQGHDAVRQRPGIAERRVRVERRRHLSRGARERRSRTIRAPTTSSATWSSTTRSRRTGACT